MGISIGGGLGPIGGRIGTRGIGLRLGPVSLTAGSGAGQVMPFILATAFQALLIFLLLAWPWIVVVLIAGIAGAEMPDSGVPTWINILGWTAEAACAAGVIYFLWRRFGAAIRERRSARIALRESLRRYESSVEALEGKRQPRIDDRQLPLKAIVGWSSDGLIPVYAGRPIRSCVNRSLGVWFGAFRAEGKFQVLLERAATVQRLVACDTKDELDLVWDEVKRFCDGASVH